jgi:nucleoside-diphosphate-sugar epimerase
MVGVLTKMKIIITGSSGFVGKNLNSYLESFDIEKMSVKYRHDQTIWISKTNAIIHLSGKAHDLKNVSEPQEYYDANYELTKQVFDAFLTSEATKFIFVSSVKAAADSVADILVEGNLPNPYTHYGKSKLMAEHYIQSQPLPEGKSYYILRPCMIHGPGNKGNLNLLYNLVSKGVPYPLASFSNRRSFLSVENLCFIIKEILERDDIPSGIYNVTDDEPLSTNEVVSLLAAAENKAPRLWHIPENIILMLAKIGDKLKLPLTTERLQKLTENFVVSNDKIKSVLKKELPLSAREGILKTARSFKNA